MGEHHKWVVPTHLSRPTIHTNSHHSRPTIYFFVKNSVWSMKLTFFVLVYTPILLVRVSFIVHFQFFIGEHHKWVVPTHLSRPTVHTEFYFKCIPSLVKNSFLLMKLIFFYCIKLFLCWLKSTL